MKLGFGDSMEIWDWKSGHKERDKQTAWNDLQAQCSAWLMWKNYDGEHCDADGVQLPKIDEVKFTFKETRKGRSVDAEYSRDKSPYFLPDLTQEMQIEARIMECVKLYMTGCDEAWPSEKKCSWCSHVRECKYANVVAREIADDPDEYVKQYHVLDTLAKQMKKTIVDYLKAGNTIIDPDGLTARKKIPTERFTLEVVDSKKADSGVKKQRAAKSVTKKKKVSSVDIDSFA
jgi:hypothetical protein